MISRRRLIGIAIGAGATAAGAAPALVATSYFTKLELDVTIDRWEVDRAYDRARPPSLDGLIRLNADLDRQAACLIKLMGEDK
jgi:hypothetical protein